MSIMTADPPINKTSLGVGFGSNRNTPRDPQAWKTAIGNKPVPARFAVLPDGEKRWDRLGISAGIQVAIVLFFIAVPLFFPERLKTFIPTEYIPLAMPVTEVPKAPPPPPVRRRIVEPPPKPPEQPVEKVELVPQKPHIFVTQKALQKQAQIIDTKAPEPVLKPAIDEAKLEINPDQPKRPRDPVKLNNMSTGSAAPATLKNLPPSKVQTGGFGDPNGLPGQGDPNKMANVNRQGDPRLPGGPGYGNGTGGANGARGTIASTGFGNGTANPPSGGGHRGSVQSSGFNDQTVAEAPKKVAAPQAATSTVTILDKPRPQYTAEGRELKLEGDVVLDLVFLANGSVHVNRVISGLGHGLDENAIRAAEQIKFKPALREGQSVDYPARVRIEFRLAY